jgi:hypothetical protein
MAAACLPGKCVQLRSAAVLSSAFLQLPRILTRCLQQMHAPVSQEAVERELEAIMSKGYQAST